MAPSTLKFALFLDVDNLNIDTAKFEEIIYRIKNRGELLYGKVYGYNDRKHKDKYPTIAGMAFDLAGPMLNKRSKKSVIDNRIIVDAVKMAFTNHHINAFCIGIGSGNISALLSMLRTEGKYLVGVFGEHNEQSREMCNESMFLEITTTISGKNFGEKQQVKPQQKRVQRVKPQEQSAQVANDTLVKMLESFARRTAELNFEIGEDVEEKQTLLWDIEAFLRQEAANRGGPRNKAEKDVFSELGVLIKHLQDTIAEDEAYLEKQNALVIKAEPAPVVQPIPQPVQTQNYRTEPNKRYLTETVVVRKEPDKVIENVYHVENDAALKNKASEIQREVPGNVQYEIYRPETEEKAYVNIKTEQSEDEDQEEYDYDEYETEENEEIDDAYVTEDTYTGATSHAMSYEDYAAQNNQQSNDTKQDFSNDNKQTANSDDDEEGDGSLYDF